MTAESILRGDKYTQEMARRIYRSMPGAQMRMPGEFEHLPEYIFAEQLALEIICAAQAYSK